MSEEALPVPPEIVRKTIGFRKALSSESDRGCALFAGAFLDAALSDLLYVSLVASNRIEKDLFQGNAPLSTFSSRILLSFYIGLISSDMRRDLDIIRKIRNDFAHNIEITSFSDPVISDRSRTLMFSPHEQNTDPRSHFVTATMGLLSYIHLNTFSTVPHEERTQPAPAEGPKATHRQVLSQILAKRSRSSDSDVGGD